jgi:hypothetical protein
MMSENLRLVGERLENELFGVLYGDLFEEVVVGGDFPGVE